MSAIRLLISSATALATTFVLTGLASGQAYVPQVSGEGGNAAYMPQVPADRRPIAGVAPAVPAAPARVQRPANPARVGPQFRVDRADLSALEAVRSVGGVSTEPPVVSQPVPQRRGVTQSVPQQPANAEAVVSRYPSVGNGVQFIFPSSRDGRSLPSVGRGAVAR